MTTCGLNHVDIFMFIVQPEDLDWDEFGNDLYAIPEATPVQSSNQVQDAPPPSKADEESKIKALIDTPALDWQRWESLLLKKKKNVNALWRV